MPEGPDGKTIIIVKKVAGHGGHHGGAWKVAYADFVTAMMALFMVLWLVNSASVTTRERIASYFREPGVFEKGSGTPLQEGGAGILPDAFSPPASENATAQHSEKIYRAETSGEVAEAFTVGKGEGEAKEKIEAGRQELERLAEQIRKQIEEAASKIGEDGKLLGKIEIKVDQRGLHIEIMDTDKASMFELGSARISAIAEEELGKIATILVALPNPIDIEGHTDGRPFNAETSANYDNWNLSSDRANVARRILLKAGVQHKQIARVVGYADQRLKYPDNALADGNRRISISMRFTELANKALEGTQTSVTEARKVRPLNATEETSNKSTQESAATSEAKAVEETKPKTAAQSKLRVEVGTEAPEGEPLPDREAEKTDPTWMEKDKIFGNRNPFFTP